MSKVLIITQLGDIHAAAAQWGLRQLGHECWRWLPETLGSSCVSLRFGDGRAEITLATVDGALEPGLIETVWLRRFSVASIPDSIADGDRIVARRETENFLRGLQFSFGKEVQWINAPAAQRIAGLKARQLVAAQRVGLKIPETIMTNDIEAVRSFMSSSTRRVVYKGFHPAFWHINSSCRYWLTTSLVTEKDLADPDSLRFSPGIFQEFTPKQCELRITVFGKTCIAAQLTEQDEIDWRINHAMKVSPFELPREIESKLLALMSELGLAMGAIDMIVTPEGEFVFLEVNEQGQFLWIEEKNPNIRLLDPFVGFLIAGDPNFRWRTSSDSRLSFADYLSSQDMQTFERTELAVLDEKPVMHFGVAENPDAGHHQSE